MTAHEVINNILSEVESIADTIGVICRGTMRKEISMKEIAEKNTAYIELTVGNLKRAAYILADQLGLENFKVSGESGIRIYDADADANEIAKALMVHDVEICSIGKKSETLEDYFLRLTEGSAGV